MLCWLKGQEMVQWFSMPEREEAKASYQWYWRPFDRLVVRWL